MLLLLMSVVVVVAAAVVDERPGPMRGTLLGVHHPIFFVIIPLPLYSVIMFYLPIPAIKKST